MGANREAHEVCRKSLAMLLFVCFALSMYIGCSHVCFSSVDIVVCRGQNFSAVPANLSDLIWRLDLGSNAITSLSSSWTPRPLLRLEVLGLAQNALGTIVPGAFVSTPHLRHLDLSSNRLKWLIGGIFKGLNELEELLLFDNHLGRISGWAFEGLGGLQRLHLGRNRLTHSAAPRDVRRRGVFVQAQSLCGVPGQARRAVTSSMSRFTRTTGVISALGYPRPGGLTRGGPSPARALKWNPRDPKGAPGRFWNIQDSKVISGGQQGSEKLVEVDVSDSEIASTPHQSENVHTGFTALVSWIVSIILLLSYLYFSPCHCRCRRKHLGLSRPAKGNPQLQAQPSTAKKVVFVEPWMEVTAIDVAHSTGDSTGAANPVTTRSILKNGGNTSDPPIREICHLI
ncbi:uncharacterized protein LOC143136832 [Alosa pseudoharengus]|uniref:uncharacterized protein LOC143136832 n=1 Tax=Alosa pseudoharengus TaxID=34774 RepID=UPI003F887FD7